MAVTNLDAAVTMAGDHRGPVMPLLRNLLQYLGQRLAQGRLPDLIKLIISESRTHPDLGRLYLERVVSRAFPFFRSLIERGVASGEFRAVDNISFELRRGEILTLLGPSGCGKTTTLRCVAGLEHPTSGRISIGGQTYTDPQNGVLVPPRSRNLGMVFQS